MVIKFNLDPNTTSKKADFYITDVLVNNQYKSFNKNQILSFEISIKDNPYYVKQEDLVKQQEAYKDIGNLLQNVKTSYIKEKLQRVLDNLEYELQRAVKNTYSKYFRLVVEFNVLDEYDNFHKIAIGCVTEEDLHKELLKFMDQKSLDLLKPKIKELIDNDYMDEKEC